MTEIRNIAIIAPVVATSTLLLENPRFSTVYRPALLNGKTTVFPTPFAQRAQLSL